MNDTNITSFSNTLEIQFPDNSTLVHQYISGNYFGRVFFNSSYPYMIIDTPSDADCNTLLSTTITFCKSDQSDLNISHSSMIFFNQTVNISSVNQSSSGEDLNIGRFNISSAAHTYFCCTNETLHHPESMLPSALPSFLPSISLPSPPQPPLQVRYDFPTHTLIIDPASDLLIPDQWLVGKDLPNINCSMIFDSLTLYKLSGGSSEVECFWRETTNKSSLIIRLPRTTLLRQTDEITFKFTVKAMDTIVKAIYSDDPDVEFDHKPGLKQLLGLWGLYAKRRSIYQQQLNYFSHNASELLSLNWTISVESSSRSPTIMPTYAPSETPSHRPTFSSTTSIPSESPTRLPSLIPTIQPTFLPTVQSKPVAKSSSKSPTLLPSTRSPTFLPSTQSPTFLPSTQSSRFLPSRIPSRNETFAPSMTPSYSTKLLECTVLYSTAIIFQNVNSISLNLKLLSPYVAFSPCTTLDCLTTASTDKLLFDASSSYSGSIFSILFSWSVLNITDDPTYEETAYDTETKRNALDILQREISAVSSPILRVSNSLLLAGLVYTFQVTARLNSTWFTEILATRKTSFALITSPLPIPAVTISDSYPLELLLPNGSICDTLMLFSRNWSYFIHKGIVLNVDSTQPLSASILLPTQFLLLSELSFTFLWQIYEIYSNFSVSSHPIYLLNSSEPLLPISKELMRVANQANRSSYHLLHLTIFTGAIFQSKELNSKYLALLQFDTPAKPTAFIIGGSRCIFPGVDLYLKSQSVSTRTPTSFRWSCWIVDTNNRDSYNIGGSDFDHYSQCSTGEEFYQIRQEITEADKQHTLNSISGSGCAGYMIKNNQSPSFSFASEMLQFGVMYKFCVEVYFDNDFSLSCIGVYVYIPVNSAANHYTGVNNITEPEDHRSLNQFSSWQPFELIPPFLTPSHNPDVLMTKYSLNPEYSLKLTVQTSSPFKPRAVSQLICSSSFFPFTTWKFRSQVPLIFRNSPSAMNIHHLKNSANFVNFPFSSNPSVFGYFSFRFPQNYFLPGRFYTFSISSTCSERSDNQNDNSFTHRGYSEITIAIPQPPRAGNFQVLPRTAIAFETSMFLEQENWIASDFLDLPLQYAFYYTSYLSKHDIYDIHDAEEFFCLRDWSYLPHTTITLPMGSRIPLRYLYSQSDLSLFDFWNVTYASNLTSLTIVLHGFVRDANGGRSSVQENIEISPPWDIPTISFTSLSEDSSNILTDQFQNDLLSYVGTIHTYISELFHGKFQALYFQRDHLVIYHYLLGMSAALNTLPIHYFEQKEDIITTRYKLRSKILDFLFNSSHWIYTTEHEITYISLSYHFLTTIIQVAALPDEISELSKSKIVQVIEFVVSKTISASHSIWGAGYFDSKYCSEVYNIKTVDTVANLLTTLDRIAPDVNIFQNNETLRVRESTYRKTMLGLKALLVGCSLPGERVGSAGESNYYQSTITLDTLFPTQAPTSLYNISLNSTDGSNYSFSNFSFSPTTVPTYLDDFQMRYGSQIGVLRQSIYGGFSQIAVTVGSDVDLLFQNNSGINSTVTNSSRVSVVSVSRSSRVGHQPQSFLQLPCDTSRLNSCKMSQIQISLSGEMRNEIAIEDIFGIISKEDSIIDLSIANVPLLESSYQVDSVDRSWIPFQGTSGVSDAVIVEFKTSCEVNQSFFNLSSSIEVGVKVSRPDVLWKLAVVNSESNMTNIRIDDKYSRRSLRGDDSESNGAEPLLIFSPRWVRCELLNTESMEWIKPDWLDGWWSPDVASFATESELRNAAQKYFIRSSDKDTEISPTTSYLAVNTSVSKLPTSLSCFLNSLSISSIFNETVSIDRSIWLQWRTVSQTQDPCGGCSGHGVCVLFRTAPICLCQNNYRGRFCDKMVIVNATKDGSNRQWHLSMPLAPSGLQGVAYIICFILAFLLFFQVIKKLVFYLLMSEDDYRTIYSILRSGEADMMTVTEFLDNDRPNLNHNTRSISNNSNVTEEITYSIISGEEENPFSDISITSTITPRTTHRDIFNQRERDRSWIPNILQSFGRYFTFNYSIISSHRDDDLSPPTATDEHTSSVFIATQTDGNGIEILDHRDVSRNSSQENRQNENHHLMVRGIQLFSEESKSLRNYHRLHTGKSNESDVANESDQGLRLRKSTNLI